MKAKAPTLSVIIADVNGPPVIVACLKALARQRGEVDAEVIVAEATGEETARLIREGFPWVKVLPFAERMTIPELRTAALAHSNGDIIAVIEDHCDPDEHWYEEIVEAHRAHPECVAIGGVVENGKRERLIDWAVFFAEYSPYMQPMVRGKTEDIPGNNVSYKRAAFEGVDGLDEYLKQGFWESTLHQRLLDRGDRFFLEPAITVYHCKYFRFLYSLSQRFHYSRYYAGTNFSRAGLGPRLYRSAVSLALPLILMARIGQRVAKKKRHMKELIQTIPLLLIITLVWAVGELVGSLFGPGQSLYRVE